MLINALKEAFTSEQNENKDIIHKFKNFKKGASN